VWNMSLLFTATPTTLSFSSHVSESEDDVFLLCLVVTCICVTPCHLSWSQDRGFLSFPLSPGQSNQHHKVQSDFKANLFLNKEDVTKNIDREICPWFSRQEGKD
jgi:hypothetical protein